MQLKDYTDYLRLEARLITQAPREWLSWRSLRRNFIDEGHNYCEMCGWDKKLQVHHIIPRHIDKSLELEWGNLITLCRECHFRFGHFLDWKKYNRYIEEMVNQRHYWNSYMLGEEDELKCPFCGSRLKGTNVCENGHYFETNFSKELKKVELNG